MSDEDPASPEAKALQPPSPETETATSPATSEAAQPSERELIEAAARAAPVGDSTTTQRAMDVMAAAAIQREQVSEAYERQKAYITQAVNQMTQIQTQQPNIKPMIEPLVTMLQSVKLKSGDVGATMTATVPKDGLSAMTALPMLFLMSAGQAAPAQHHPGHPPQPAPPAVIKSQPAPAPAPAP